MSTALAPHRPPPRAALPLHMAARSAGGSRTPDNQDAYLALTAQGLFALSDGMGGHQGGRVASHLALDTLYAGLGQGTLSPPRITACIQRANERIVARAAQDPALEGMGATLVLAWIEGPWLHGFHIGDSRLYRLRA